MTNELEKHFFDAFEIKPKYAYLVTDMFYTSNSHNYEATKNDLINYFGDKNCGRYKVMEVHKTYPQITDRILLELICLIKTICIKCTTNQCEVIYADGAISYIGRDLKEAILNFLIPKVSIFKHQVRTLFEEGQWN